METDNKVALEDKAKEQLESFISDCGTGDLAGKRVLEIGFKNGLLLNELDKAGVKATGLEINSKLYNSVREKFRDFDIVLYDGKKFPMADESFDYVISYQVLEHVESLRDIFDECVRVLRPGGMMYHICPNYFSFYEGHYRVIWFPLFNKFLGRLYLKLFRCYTQYYETLNIIKPNTVMGSLKQHKNITIFSLGKAEFISKFSIKQIEKVKLKLLRKILKIVKKAGPMQKAVLEIIVYLNLYYPLTIIVRKDKP